MMLAEDLGPALLFCPGDRPERFHRAAQAADQSVLDLEDGVADEKKDFARVALVNYLINGPANVLVRVNHPVTPRGVADAAAVIAAGCRMILLPKTESGAEIDAIIASHAEAAAARFIVTIETARGVFALPEILEQKNVVAVSWGPYDLAADIGARAVRDTEGRLLSPLIHVRDQILLQAAAARKPFFDTVTTELRDPSLLARQAAEAAILGMHGKFAIHPSQINTIREAFCPPEAEVARCRRLLAVEPGHGAFLFEGEMIDAPMLRRARRTLAIFDRAGGRVQTEQ